MAIKAICRLCMSQRRKMIGIFAIANCNKLKYIDMMTSIANVKINYTDACSDLICRSCTLKIEESYEFKLLIERSYATATCQNKKILNFSNINEVEAELNIIKVENIDNKKKIKFKFEDENMCVYKDTTINKLDSNKRTPNTDDVEKKLMSILEFVGDIKEENENAFSDDHDYSDSFIVNSYDGSSSKDDDEYLPPEVTKLKKNKKSRRIFEKDEDYLTFRKKDKKIIKTDSQKMMVPNKHTIRPVLLADLRLVKSKKSIGKKTKPHRKYVKEESICPYCGKLTKTMASHLLQHTGDKKFKCDQCPSSYYTAGGLKNHLAKHSGVLLKCDSCTASFHSKDLLNSHMRVHNTERKHICEICKKSFKRKSALRRHVLSHSSANKVVKCEQCNMSFFSKYGLNHHMRVHTGERPYNCEICSQPYSYKHDFNRHCFKKHGVFLKRRSVYVMNEEVLVKERALMKELYLRANGIVKDGEPLNPFKGPQAAQAFQQAIQVIQSKQLPI